jgi:selenocysteine lyase/cysteine desulfurase
MTLSRRRLLAGLGAVTAARTPAPRAAERYAPSLPDRSNFRFSGVYLDAAFVHPLGLWPYAYSCAYAAQRLREPSSVGPGHNQRDAAVERFARLINARPQDIAVVPSTMTGENLIVRSLRIGKDAGVVTDALHYDASLVLYSQLRRHGTPVGIALPVDNRIRLDDLRALITPATRLVSVSLVSADTGFTHDLAELCSMAHRRGALVYADIIQAAGAIPVDVGESGVDFCCCGTYKWLMGEFGTAFLYIRPDRLDRLQRVELGWRQVTRDVDHQFPFDPPGPVGADYALRNDAVGLFEVSTPGWGPLATAVGSLEYLHELGVDAIVRHRQPMIDRLQRELPPRGLVSLTPPGSRAPIVAFAYRDAEKRWSDRLRAARIRVSLYAHRVRIAVSVYNTMDDIERLLAVLT